MKLYEVLPDNLFSILASKNKEIYVEALFVLRRAFKQEMSISRLDLISMLIANLDEMMLEIDMSEEENGSDSQEGREATTLSATAHYLLRRLRDTGWVDTEYQLDSFEENITLPDYSIKIINLLHSLTDESIKEYNSYVYSTYSVLKTADLERDDFMYNALLTAYDNTVRLIDELKTLHNNIRRYHQALNEYATVNDVLKGHFDEYKGLIMDRIYHPLKTLDSVPRFKMPILKILGNWLSDNALRERMAEQAMLRGKYRIKEEAAEDIILKIGEISDAYERLDEMLEDIDRKNSAYTRASIEKMRYLINSDRSIKGKLVELLMHVSGESYKGSGISIEQLGEAVELYKQRYVDEKSLYKRAARDKRKDGKPMEVRVSEGGKEAEALAEFLSKTRNAYSHTRVMNYVKDLMHDVDAVTTRDISIADDETFILLMLAVLNSGERNAFYNVEFLEEYLEKNGYRIPELLFVRKEQ
ncbi:MAG: DUF5716 family protein [Clostridiaceae bacterium]|nr:DUF5716 family protein [Clostridiaceae bacterium]